MLIKIILVYYLIMYFNLLNMLEIKSNVICLIFISIIDCLKSTRVTNYDLK